MKKKQLDRVLIIIVVLIVIGTVAICSYGEYSIRRNYKSNVTNAKEVMGPLPKFSKAKLPGFLWSWK